MRTPIFLVLLAISAAVDAYVIPKRGKYPSFIVNSSPELTTVLFAGNKHHLPHLEQRTLTPDGF